MQVMFDKGFLRRLLEGDSWQPRHPASNPLRESWDQVCNATLLLRRVQVGSQHQHRLQ